MKKKTLLTLLLSFMMLFGIGGFAACQLPNNSESISESGSDSSANNDVDSTTSEEEKDSSSSGTSIPSLTPAKPDEGDFAALSYVSSIAPDRYGATAKLSLQAETVSQNSSSALMGSFNNKNAETYTGADGGKWVWTFLSFDFQKIYGAPTILNNTSFVFDVRTENCGPNSSILLVDKDGNFSDEIPFSNQNANDSDNILFTRKRLSDSWTRVTVNLPLVFSEKDALKNICELRLVFSNAYGNNNKNSVFYIDNAHWEKAIDYTVEVPDVYNPDGYYSKSDDLKIMLASSRYNYYDTQIWLDEIFEENDVNASIEHSFSYTNSGIDAAYEKAFGAGGYMLSLDRPNVLLTTGFFRKKDYFLFGTFLNSCYQYAPSMEVIACADEFQTDDGKEAAQHYGVDFCDWKTVTSVLRSNYGFTDAHLIENNSHNNLSALIDALSIYARLYGELPEQTPIENKIIDSAGDAFDDLTILLPGITEAQKRQSIQIIFDVVESVVINGYTPTPPVTPDDSAVVDQGDYAVPEYTKTVIVADYNTHSTLTLQNQTVSENSTSALQGSFHKKDANSVYTGEGGEWVWSLLTFDLTAIYGAPINLNNSVFTFDVKTENCESNIRLALLYDSEKYGGKEYNTTVPPTGIGVESLENGWRRITINFSVLYTEEELTDVAGVVLLFGNPNCDESKNSVYWLDNAAISFTSVTPYPSNRNGYYSKSESVDAMVIGNSFVYYSQSAYWLETIGELNGASLTAGFSWVPNGTIKNHYDNAFGTNGYYTATSNWVPPTVVFMQDFYSTNDITNFGEYLDAFYAYHPSTELKVYPGENETNDGAAAAILYGVDLVDWKTLIQSLKTNNGYTATNLNDAVDGWHPNQISGVAGAVLMYMDLYGEIPDVASLADQVLTHYDFYGTPIKNYLPGTTDAEKKLEVEKIVKAAATLLNLQWKTTCWHEYEWTTENAATCNFYGWQTGVCKNCGYTTHSAIPPLGHNYSNGTCQNCGATESAPDLNDYANTDYVSTVLLGTWNVHANLTLQSAVITPLTNTTSALKASFNNKGADAYTEEGGNWVWTALAFDVNKLTGGTNVVDKTLQLNIKTTNCDRTASIILVDTEGNLLDQIAYDVATDNENAPTGMYKIVENDGWITMYFRLSEIYSSYDLTKIKQICLIFSNAYSDESQDSIVYLDNAQFW